jgi:hypothetical protein
MTTNQIVAMLFPLLAVVAVGLTGLFIRKPWNDHKAERSVPTGVEQDIRQAQRLLDHALQGSSVHRHH